MPGDDEKKSPGGTAKYTRVIKSGLKLKRPVAGTKLGAPKRKISPATEEPPKPQENGTDDAEAGPPEMPGIDPDVARVLARDDLTISEKEFMIAQAKRRQEKIQQDLALTHREKIAKLNDHLSKLSEHFDVPKVGPG